MRLVNCGVGGDTLFDLIPRLESDVLAHKPDWIFVMIGTNDMNRRLYGGGKNGAEYEKRRAVCRERFGRKLNELLERLKKSGGGRVVLMSPPCYDEYTSGDPARENNVGADRALADFTAIAAETAGAAWSALYRPAYADAGGDRPGAWAGCVFHPVPS